MDQAEVNTQNTRFSSIQNVVGMADFIMTGLAQAKDALMSFIPKLIAFPGNIIYNQVGFEGSFHILSQLRMKTMYVF